MPALLKSQDVAVSPDEQERTARRLYSAAYATVSHPFGTLSVSAGEAFVVDQRGCCVRHNSSVGDDFASRECL